MLAVGHSGELARAGWFASFGEGGEKWYVYACGVDSGGDVCGGSICAVGTRVWCVLYGRVEDTIGGDMAAAEVVAGSMYERSVVGGAVAVAWR